MDTFPKQISKNWLAIQILVLTIVYSVARVFVFELGVAVQNFHFEGGDSFLIEALQDWNLQWRIVFFLSPLLFFARLKWKDFDNYRALRALIVSVAGVIVWTSVFSDYNFYLDKPFYLEKGIILAGLGLSYFNPAFIPITLFLSLMSIFQFRAPIGNYSFTDKLLVLEFLQLFVSFLYLRIVGRFSVLSFIALSLALVANPYLISGLGKMSIEWYRYENLFYLSAGTTLNGWLWFLSQSTIESILPIVRKINMVLIVSALVVECGAISLVFVRKWLPLVLCALASLHIGILVASGIFFWKWVLLDVFFAGYFWRTKPHRSKELSSRLVIAILFFVALTGHHYAFQKINLTWYDTPLVYHYTIVGIDSQGKEHGIPSTYFAPFDMVFAQGRFHYLNPHPTRGGIFGVDFDRKNVDLLLREDVSKDDIDEHISTQANIRYDSHLTSKFTKFAKKWIGYYNTHRPLKREWYRPPHHIQFAGTDRSYPQLSDQEIVAVEVHYKESLLREYRYETLKDEVILKIIK